MEEESNPVLATLYVFQLRRRIVRIAIGQWPPDPCCHWDSLTRIPIAANGARPPWRAFTVHHGENLGQALDRSRWPEDKSPDLRILRLRSARQARREADGQRRSQLRTPRLPLPSSGGGSGRGVTGGENGASSPAPPPPIAPARLGQAPSGARYTFDRRTRQYLRLPSLSGRGAGGEVEEVAP